MRVLTIGLVVFLISSTVVCAAVVDSSHAEQLYQSGNYQEAYREFLDLLTEFSETSKDSKDYRSYRELAYIYDRLADCSFTERDWPSLKLYMDGMLEVTTVEANLVENQLSGAIAAGVAQATASYLYERVDESVRITSIVPLKRSLALYLLDSNGKGHIGETAIREYQRMAALMVGVMEVDEGYYTINIAKLEQKVDDFSAIHTRIEDLGDIEKLWEKYPVPSREPESAEK